jgi:HEPN domain-containing protein
VKPFWDRLPGLLARHGQNPVVARWIQQSLGSAIRKLYADERAHGPLDHSLLKELIRDYITGHPT